MDTGRPDIPDTPDSSPLARLRARFALPAARPAEAVGATPARTPDQQRQASQPCSLVPQRSQPPVSPSAPPAVPTCSAAAPLRIAPAVVAASSATSPVSKDEEADEPDDSGVGDDEWPPRYSFPMDWHQKYRIERATLRQRLRRCRDGGVRRVLRELLAYSAPVSEGDWLRLGTRWQMAEETLRREGRLPPVEDPTADRMTNGDGRSRPAPSADAKGDANGLVLPGKYHVRLEKVEKENFDGRPCFKFTFRILADTYSLFTGQRVTERLFVGEPERRRLILFAARLGLLTPGDFGFKSVPRDWKDVLGQQVVIEVVNRTSTRPDGSEVKVSGITDEGIWRSDDPEVTHVRKGA